MERKIVVMCVLFALYAAGNDAVCEWKRMNGPFSARVNGMASSGTTLYTVTQTGLFSSTDNGATWTVRNIGLPSDFSTSLAGITVSGSTIVVGAYNGMHRSVDNGVTWTYTDHVLGSNFMTAIGSVNSRFYAGTDHGLYRSIDNGATWTAANTGLPATPYIRSIVSCDSTLILSTNANGIYVSTNYGDSWVPFNLAWSSTTYIQACVTIGTRTFIGTYENGGGGVYLLTRTGTTFAAVKSATLRNAVVYQLAAIGQALFAGTTAGVWRSDDYADTWTQTGTGLPPSYIVSAMTVLGANIFLGASGSGPVYRSEDRGAHWTETMNGMIGQKVRSLAATHTKLFAGTDGGLFAAPLADSTWTYVNFGWQYSSAAFLTTAGDSVYTGNFYGVNTSTDNGATWKNSRQGTPSSTISSLIVAGPKLYLASYGSVYISTDNAATWSSLIGGYTGLWFTSVGAAGATVLAGGDFKNGLLRSTDYGSSWTPVTSGLPADSYIEDIVRHQSEFYVNVLDRGIYRSSDDGVSWKYAGLSNVTPAALLSSGAQLYVGTTDGVMLTSDKGVSWEAIDAGLPAMEYPQVAVSDKHLYVSTLSGVWMRPLFEVSAVITVHPADGRTGVQTSTTLSWNEFAGAATYSVQVSKTRDFSTMLTNVHGLTVPMYPVSGLSEYTTYYWRVRAENGTVVSLWTTPRSFTTGMLPPVTAWPGDGAQNVSKDSVAFRWNASAGAVSYRMQLSAARDFSILLSDKGGIATTTTTVTGLSYATTYYWRINAMVAAAESTAWSPVQAFTTLVPPPVTVQLVSPVDGWKSGTDSVRFVWRRGTPQITSYELELAGDTTITKVVTDTVVVLAVKGVRTEKMYFWRVRAINTTGTGEYCGAWSMSRLATSVPDLGALPTEYALLNNFPNPFNPSTTIAFDLPSRSRVNLQIFDTYGRTVATVVNEELPAGRYTRQWGAAGLPSGMYFFRLQAGTHAFTKRMLLLK